MADEVIETKVDGTSATGSVTDDETPEKLKAQRDKAIRDKDQAFSLLRSRDLKVSQMSERLKSLDTLEAEMTEIKRRLPAATATAETTTFDPNVEPDINTDPTNWMKWKDRRDEQRWQQLQQQNNARSEIDALNAYGQSAEVAAKAQYPDYDDAMAFLKKDYQDELMETGELRRAAKQALRDPSQKQNIEAYALDHGMSETEAALELCAVGAWNWRRNQIVAEARESGDNPAAKAYKLAQRRGYKGKGEAGGMDGTKARTATQVDASLAEMERKRNLKAAEQSLSDVRGAEPQDKRVWNRRELEDLQRNNPAGYRRAIREIAEQANAEGAQNVLPSVITK